MAAIAPDRFDMEFTFGMWRVARKEGRFMYMKDHDPSTSALVLIEDYTYVAVAPSKRTYASATERAMKEHTTTLIRFVRRKDASNG